MHSSVFSKAMFLYTRHKKNVFALGWHPVEIEISFTLVGGRVSAALFFFLFSSTTCSSSATNHFKFVLKEAADRSGKGSQSFVSLTRSTIKVSVFTLKQSVLNSDLTAKPIVVTAFGIIHIVDDMEQRRSFASSKCGRY